jgi:hypothetical protein
MRKPMAGFLLRLVLGSGVAPADTAQRKTALLVEAHGMQNMPDWTLLSGPCQPTSIFVFRWTTTFMQSASSAGSTMGSKT